jgi:hypothetical protein
MARPATIGTSVSRIDRLKIWVAQHGWDAAQFGIAAADYITSSSDKLKSLWGAATGGR